MENYSHRQTSTLTLIGGVVTAGIVVAAAWTAPEFPSWLTVAFVAFILIVLGQFSSLTTIVTDDAVVARFGSGYIRRTISLAQIKSVKVVRNVWIMGWGIRMIQGGWMFNVAGLDAVDLELVSGSHFRIGTDEPQHLEAAILQALSRVGRRG